MKLEYDLYTILSEKEYFMGELCLSHLGNEKNSKYPLIYVSTDKQSLLFKVPK